MDNGAELSHHYIQDEEDHQCEILADIAEGSRKFEGCAKNPGHCKFIPVYKFALWHLPEGYRDSRVFECVRALSTLAVMITVDYTSKERPRSDHFYNERGTRNIRTGSGCVKSVEIGRERGTFNATCPCHVCARLDVRQQLWWECTILTAKHVVFDDEEAKKTVVRVFYDNDDVPQDQIKRLYGVRVFDEDLEGDRCQFVCVTHDKELANRLINAVDVSITMYRAMTEGFAPELGRDNANLCVVVSHPHGCSKFITVGCWKGCLKQGEDTVLDQLSAKSLELESNLSCVYDTLTCSGSSGGPILLLGLWDPIWTDILGGYYFCHTHRSHGTLKATGEKVNKSCYWPVLPRR